MECIIGYIAIGIVTMIIVTIWKTVEDEYLDSEDIINIIFCGILWPIVIIIVLPYWITLYIMERINK